MQEDEVLHILVAYIEHQERELALEKLRYGDAELEIRDLKGLLHNRANEIEKLQQRRRLQECNSRRAFEKENREGDKNLALYCKELESIIEVLEERLNSDGSRNAAFKETESRLEAAVSYASELEDRLIESTRKWEGRGSPLRAEGIAPLVLESLSPTRCRPKKSVGTQARALCACGQKNRVEVPEKELIPDLETATLLKERDEEIQRLGNELAQLASLYKDSSSQVEDLRLLLRRTMYEQSSVFDLSASYDDDMTVTSTDSRRFMSKRWLSGKVQELRKRLPMLKSGAIHPICHEEGECDESYGDT